MAETTWGSLWWRIKLLVRIWFNDARRWVVARRRARRIATARKHKGCVSGCSLCKPATSAPVYVSDKDAQQALRQAYLSQALGAGLMSMQTGVPQRSAQEQRDLSLHRRLLADQQSARMSDIQRRIEQYDRRRGQQQSDWFDY